MPIFNYSARDMAGKVIKGTVEAVGQKEAVALIRERKLFITSIEKQKTSALTSPFARFHKISFNEIANFTRQISTMITAGLQLQDALSLLAAQSTNSGLTDMINQISREIQEGGNFGNALAKYPQYFSKSYIALVRAGESSGTLDVVLERLADNLEKDQDFRSKVQGAMIYPAIVLSAMVVVFALLMIVVVPKLTELYSDFEAELPLQTKILIGISDLSVKFWWLLLIAIVAGYRFFKKWKATPVGARTFDSLILKLPLIGPLQKQIILVEFTRTLGMLVGAGVHILESLTILIDSMNNVLYRDAVKEIAKKVEKGFPLGALFAQYPIFPPLLAQMIKVGEETGKMDESLMKLSTYFERESDATVKALTTAIEPLIMIILGIGVGFIVFAIVTPLYNLTSQIK